MEDNRSKGFRQAELVASQADPFAETAFADLMQAAADTFGVSMSSITIVGSDGRWSKSSHGVPPSGIPGSAAFSTLALASPGQLTVVEDTMLDPRFASIPLAESALRFYAAAPLIHSTGRAIGVMCVKDTRPHRVDPEKLQQLKFLADQVVATLEARDMQRR